MSGMNHSRMAVCELDGRVKKSRKIDIDEVQIIAIGLLLCWEDNPASRKPGPIRSAGEGRDSRGVAKRAGIP